MSKFDVRFSLRMPESVHEEIKKLAEQEGVSMNQYMVYALARHIWDPQGEGKIQLAPPVAEQRRQMRAFRKKLQPASDEEVQKWLAEREAIREEAEPQERKPVPE